MAEIRSPEEVRAEAVNAMPDSLGELYYALHGEVAWLHLKWKGFRTLFDDTSQTVDLLNEAAPDFFGNLQRMMWEDVLLHLCRLTDPVKSAGKETLTVLRIGSLISDAQLKRAVVTAAEDARSKTEFARDWRNRRLV